MLAPLTTRIMAPPSTDGQMKWARLRKVNCLTCCLYNQNCGGCTSCLAGTEDVVRVEEGELPGLLPLHRTVAASSPV